MHKTEGMPQDPQYLGAAEVAERLGIHRSTLTRWITTGRIKPAMQMPGSSGAYLFRQADVEGLRREIDAEQKSA